MRPTKFLPLTLLVTLALFTSAASAEDGQGPTHYENEEDLQGGFFESREGTRSNEGNDPSQAQNPNPYSTPGEDGQLVPTQLTPEGILRHATEQRLRIQQLLNAGLQSAGNSARTASKPVPPANSQTATPAAVPQPNRAIEQSSSHDALDAAPSSANLLDGDPAEPAFLSLITTANSEEAVRQQLAVLSRQAREKNVRTGEIIIVGREARKRADSNALSMRMLSDFDLDSTGYADPKRIIDHFGIRSSPAWIVHYKNADYIFEGQFNIDSYFTNRGAFLAPNVATKGSKGPYRFEDGGTPFPAQLESESVFFVRANSNSKR